MTGRRVLIVAVAAIAAIVAGIWAGGAVSPAPARGVDTGALTRFDAARGAARARLGAGTTPRLQRLAAKELSAVYRRAALTLPDQAISLHRAASAYDALGAASGPAAYADAARRVLHADAALAAALRRPAGAPGEPLIPPILPLVLLVSAAAGVAVSTRLG